MSLATHRQRDLCHRLLAHQDGTYCGLHTETGFSTTASEVSCDGLLKTLQSKVRKPPVLCLELESNFEYKLQEKRMSERQLQVLRTQL